MRALVAGSKGMLGTELMGLIEEQTDWDPTGADVDEFDITSAESTAKLVRDVAPGVIFNCVAFTNVDAAETHRDLAFAVNATGVGHLADAAGKAKLVHISTDFVFDGRKEGFYVEDDPTGPLGVYGESKLEGERLLFERKPDAVCLRTAWLYGPHGKNFVATIMKYARERDHLDVVTDEAGSPTYTLDLAQAMVDAASAGLSGIYHCANGGMCSRFELAKAALELADIQTPVHEITSDAWDRPAAVPANSALDCAKLEHALGRPVRQWWTALADYVRRVTGGD